MLTYKYSARDTSTGQRIDGVISADSEQAAATMIKQQGYAPLSIELEDKFSLGFINNRVKSKDKVIFSRQLSTLINAGLPLVQSLRSVLNQTKNAALQGILTQVISDVEGGKNFSASLAKHPQVFNQVFVSLVAAGETSGTLDVALERIANQQEKDAELVSKVRGAMVYPVIVLLVMAGVVTFMLVSVLPQVKELYEGIPGATLPLITRILMAISNFLVSFWWLIALILVIAVVFTSRWARTLGGKVYIDKLKLHMWPVGTLFRKMYMSRFARTGTTLVASGVPLIQVLEITGKAVGNVHIEDAILRAAHKVKGGKSLSSSLENEPEFIDLVPQMIKIGEDSGAIEQMLEKTADYYEKEVDNQIKSISTIIEPVLMIILGIVAITIVSAILLPIYGLVGKNIVR